MEQRPLHTYSVVVLRAAKLSELSDADKRLRTLPFLPLGYPAVDQAAGIQPGKKGFVLLAGKFARKNWAQTLAKAIAKAGFESVGVHTASYRFDTNRPALNELTQIKAGRIFSGMANTAVPLLAQPSTQAQGSGMMLDDGTLVEVVDQKLQGVNLWYRIAHGQNKGYLPAKRVLVDYNVFSEPTDRFGVLGVSLSCLQGDCRWDYWLIGKNNTRRLLKSAGTRMPHAFSTDSRWLAYTTMRPTLKLTSLVGMKNIDLGPGISPAFSPDGSWLYFRGPGVRKQRDQVLRIALGDIDKPNAKELVRSVLDFRGTPFYPRAIASIPPAVDTLEDGELFTLFFRVGEKRGQRQIQRWGVRFTPDGKILGNRGRTDIQINNNQ